MHTLTTHLEKDKRYLVAVSFGPDSMALLHHLFIAGYTIAVAHVNYHKRKVSDLEQSQLEQWCFANNIPCFVLDVHDLKKGNFQAEARTVRYQFFNKVIREEKLDILLTAHHQDDHLETALFQLQRQSIHPYYGIQTHSMYEGIDIIHPLLNYSKASLLMYCHEHNIPYAIDASNTSTMYTRNRIRQTIAKFSSQVRAEKLQEVERMNQKMDDAYRFIRPFLLNPSVSIKDYQTWTDTQQWMYWHKLSEQYQSFRPLTHNLMNTIKKHTSSTKPNIVMTWNKTYRLYQSYGRMQLVKVANLKKFKFVVNDNQAKIVHPMWTIDLRQTKHIHIKLPLSIRSPLRSDQYLVDGHHKPLLRLMIDWKMPLYLRQVWPVFVYKNKIVYIPRYRRKQETSANEWLIVNE